jgi:hypothetical protein
VEVEGELVPSSEPSPTEVVTEGAPEGAPFGFAANYNILVEEPDSPPHQGMVMHQVFNQSTPIT